MRYFMIDIETMGTNPETDDIIQIGLLELIQRSDGTYLPGLSYERTLYSAQIPSEYIARMHADLLPRVRYAPRPTQLMVRCEIVGFFRACGVNEPAMLMGLNATTFDVPFLVHKGYLRKPYQDENGTLTGDYHYRIYELKGAYNLAQDVLGVDSKQLFTMAEAEASDVVLPPGKKHEALYDCYKQLRTLNGIIRLLRYKRAS